MADDSKIISNEKRFEPGLKLVSHPRFGEYLEGGFIFPINIEISPSGKCDAGCKACFYRQAGGNRRELDGQLFRTSRMEGLINEMAGVNVKSISWTGGGEPTLHPSFPKFVELANWAGLEQGLFTNALKPIEYDPTVFEWIRVTKTNKDLNKDVLESLRQCKTLGICINYDNECDEGVVGDILETAERLDSLKESPDHSTYVQVRPALKVRGELTPSLRPSIEHPLLTVTEYKFVGSDSERGYNVCEAYHFAPFIWQDGDIDICAYHRGKSKFNLGNLYEKGREGRFKYIMENSPKSIQVEDDCQICCKLNAMNSIVNMMKQLKDVNFP